MRRVAPAVDRQEIVSTIGAPIKPRLALGPLGVGKDAEIQGVLDVYESQNEGVGVTSSTTVRKLGGAHYTDDILQEKKKDGSAAYTVVLDRTRKQPLSSELLGNATRALSHQEEPALKEVLPAAAMESRAEDLLKEMRRILKGEMRSKASTTSDTHHKEPSLSMDSHVMRVQEQVIVPPVIELSETSIMLQLKPGPLGIRIDSNTGEILGVYDGQGNAAGLTVGMRIRRLDGADYTDDLLWKKQEGKQEYTVVLHRPRDQPLRNQPLGIATSALHHDAEPALLKEVPDTATISSHAEQFPNDKLVGKVSPWSDTHHKELRRTHSLALTLAAHAERQEIASAGREHSEAPITLRLAPGPLGITMDPKTGEISGVYDGQGKDGGVTVGMIIRQLDGADYTDDLLLQKIAGSGAYTVVLHRAKVQPLSTESLGTTTSALHHGEPGLIQDDLGAGTMSSYTGQPPEDEMSRTASPEPPEDEMSRTASPASDTHHEEPTFAGSVDWDFVVGLLALREHPSAPQDNQRSHGPHSELQQASPAVHRSTSGPDGGEHLLHAKRGAGELFADGVWAPDANPPASQDSNRRRGPHKGLPQDNSMAKGSERNTDDDEHLQYRKGSAGRLVGDKVSAFDDKPLSSRDTQRRQGPDKTLPRDSPMAKRSKLSDEKVCQNTGHWSAYEDEQLVKLVEWFEGARWATIASRLGSRNAQQCRWRWFSYQINIGPWTSEEDQALWDLVQDMGMNWSQIQKRMPTRSEHSIENRWHTRGLRAGALVRATAHMRMKEAEIEM